MGYPGGKSGAGIYHKLINLMPPHQTYIEPFLGGGAVMRLKRPAAYNIGVDLDAEVIRAWCGAANGGNGADTGNHGGTAVADRSAANGRNAAADRSIGAAGAVEVPRLASHGGNGATVPDLVASAELPASADTGGTAAGIRSVNLTIGDRHTANPPLADPRFRFLRGDALTFLASYPFADGDLIYCDPPYVMETRSSGPRYRHEMTDEQHAELLATILDLPCRVMISGYWSELYARELRAWNSIHFQAMTRGGRMATEWVWFNFPEPVALHDYRYLGETFRERQDLKRQRERWIARLEGMSVLKKRMLLAAIASIGGND